MLGRAPINCWTVTFPARELFQKLNRSLWIVDMIPLLVLARQDMSKISATAPVDLLCRSVSTDRTNTQNRHAHKHVIGGTSIVLNTKSEPHSSEGGSGRPERGLLGRRKRDTGLGEIAYSLLSRRPRDR